MRRHAIRIALPACAVVLALAPVAAQADTIPAPPAVASGVAAQVGSLLDISQTGATAGSGAPTAGASAVNLAGQPVLNLGGTQQGDGDSGGSLLDTGASLPAQVQVAPWHAAASGTNTSTRQARGSAALARANAPQLVNAGVLTSDSQATYTDQKSTGQAVTDGFQAGVLDAIQVVLLHSEVNSEGQGHSYLVGLNGTEIGTAAQLGASPLCALNAASLLSLSCLTSTGGNGAAGATDGASQILDVVPALAALDVLNPVAAFTSTASSGTGQAPAAAAPVTTPAPVVSAETSRAIPAPTEADSSQIARGSTLARTGVAAASLAAGAFALLLLGFGLRRFRIRPTTH